MSASTSFHALGTTATVVVADELALADAEALLRSELQRIDLACSRFRDDSELARANAAAGRRVDISPLFAQAVDVALRAAERTGGIVTPTVGGALVAAGYDRTFELVRARGTWRVSTPSHPPAVWRAVELDACARTLRVPRGTELDLGATAKALAADRAAAEIAARTSAGVLVSLGGDIAVAGEPPAGGWVVRIADDHAAPLHADGPTIAIHAGGLATSSTTVRRWPTDHGEAHHVIDPRTGLPARTPWRTVSVAAASCVDANVAALAALVTGEIARGLHARLVRADGSVAYVGDWPRDAIAA